MDEPAPQEQPKPEEEQTPPRRLEKLRMELPDGRYLLLYQRRPRGPEADAG